MFMKLRENFRADGVYEAVRELWSVFADIEESNIGLNMASDNALLDVLGTREIPSLSCVSLAVTTNQSSV